MNIQRAVSDRRPRRAVRSGLVLGLAIGLASCASTGPTINSQPRATTPGTDAAAAPTVDDTTTTTSTILITRPDDPNDPTNVVVVMTDDQTVEQMRWLPNVSAYMGQGTEFSNSLTNYPLCGPSRATFLTGQHATNHGLDCNEGLAFKFHKVESNSLGPWLQDAGVHTIHVGKYLNGYGGNPQTRYVPDGWDDWRALAGEAAYDYEQFDMVLNGDFVEYGREETDDDYSTDVISDHLDEALRAAPADEPFFAVFTPLAPHYAGGKSFAVPAARHDGLVTDVLRPANFDSCSTRPECPSVGSALNMPELSPEQIDTIDNGYQTASETLFAVDEAFGRIIDTLTELSELDNTVVVFTSDNGFFYGEHGIDKGKILPGREALFVPLYVRGPGFESDRVETSPVSNVDLAPTIVDIFDATAGLESDGQSLLDPLDADRALLVQAIKAPPGGYFGVYAGGWLFYEWGELDRNELYAPDDPMQLATLDDDAEWDAVEASLAALTATMRACAGADCAVTWNVDDVDDNAVEPDAPIDDGAIVPDGAEVVATGRGTAPTVTARATVGALELSWIPIETAEGYRYRVAENGGEPSAWTRIDLETQVILDGLDPAIQYTVEVSARRDGMWRPSTAVMLSPLATAPADGG